MDDPITASKPLFLGRQMSVSMSLTTGRPTRTGRNPCFLPPSPSPLERAEVSVGKESGQGEGGRLKGVDPFPPLQRHFSPFLFHTRNVLKKQLNGLLGTLLGTLSQQTQRGAHSVDLLLATHSANHTDSMTWPCWEHVFNTPVSPASAGTSLVIQWLGVLTSSAGGSSLVSGGGAKIPHGV